MKRLKQWWHNRKERQQQIRELDIMRQFSIKERKGSLWLMCCGVAVREIPATLSAKEIVEILNEARLAGVAFEEDSWKSK